MPHASGGPSADDDALRATTFHSTTHLDRVALEEFQTLSDEEMARISTPTVDDHVAALRTTAERLGGPDPENKHLDNKVRRLVQRRRLALEAGERSRSSRGGAGCRPLQCPLNCLFNIKAAG